MSIHGGNGGNGGGGGVQGGSGGPGLGPSFGGHALLPTGSEYWATWAVSGCGSQLPLVCFGDGSSNSDPTRFSPKYVLASGRGLFGERKLLQPQPNLPAEYRRRGVAIGDVGRVTPEGSFDFFFNIYLPANHPINVNVPEDFVPLSPYDPVDVSYHDFDPGNFVSSPSVTEISDEYPEFPGGEFVFICREPTGAVLTLPHGAHLEKLENLETMRRYAAKHAERWYKYVNGTRGRGLVNGNLYLVTGCEKPQSWGMASFHSVSLQNEFQLSFRPTADADNGYRYRWRGIYCCRKQADSPLEDGTPLNQTTFIHAFAISVGEGIWEKLFGTEVCQLVDSSTFLDKSGRSFVPYGSQGSSLLWSLFFGNGTFSGGKQCSGPALAAGDGIVTDAFPSLKIIHPSQLIHERIFREVPQATVVITHDDDWRDVFKDDGVQTQGQTALELQQAIFDRFEIMEEDGAVFLGAKSDPTPSRNAATMTVDGHRTVDSGVSDHISVTPATPPNANHPEVHDMDMARVPQTPVSDSGSCDLPTPSDASQGSQLEHLYQSNPFANYQTFPFPPFTSESPPLMFLHIALDDTTRLSAPPQFPHTSSSNTGGTPSPVLPLLAFSDCEEWPSGQSVEQTDTGTSPRSSVFRSVSGNLGTLANPTNAGTSVAVVRDFVPLPVAPIRQVHPPAVSSLSASLATSGFHLPRAQQQYAFRGTNFPTMPTNRSPTLHSQEIVKRKKPPACDSCKARRVLCHPTTDGSPCPRCFEKGMKCTTTPVARGRAPKPNLGIAMSGSPEPPSASATISESASEEPETISTLHPTIPSRLELPPELVHHLFECFTHLPIYNHPMLLVDDLRETLSAVSWQIQLLPPQLKICEITASGELPCTAYCVPKRSDSPLSFSKMASRTLSTLDESICIAFTDKDARSRPWAVAYFSHIRALYDSSPNMRTHNVAIWTGFLLMDVMETTLRRQPVLVSHHDQLLITGKDIVSLENLYGSIQSMMQVRKEQPLIPFAAMRPYMFHVTRLARELYETITGDFARRHPLDERAITEFIASLNHLHSIRSLVFDQEEQVYPGDSLFSPADQRQRGVHLNLRSCAYVMAFSRATLVLALHRELVRRFALSPPPPTTAPPTEHWKAERLALLRRQVGEMADLTLEDIARSLRFMPSLPHMAHVQLRAVLGWAEFCLDEADAKGSVTRERAATIETISEALKLIGYSWPLPTGLIERLDAYVATHHPPSANPSSFSTFSGDSMFMDMFPAPVDNDWMSVFTAPSDTGNEAKDEVAFPPAGYGYGYGGTGF
ncbi:Pleiotropic drug resistance ABC transporter protein [Mycena sanguinolenta]|uniref:Pleiotropic drug resistance ABC transporter protein n=1 Tax=Mycena sanguinolenta TaxID=230812 RepID=A0A8H7DJD6_9AGAR|nr:Pleiotropic drug resistance ABC transporter protein [Mycena sanguinolenta]